MRTCWQICAWPVRHCRHLPQATCISALTRSPSLTVETPRPTAATAPENSCPGISGGWIRPFAHGIPVVNMKIGSADTGDLNANEDFTRAGRGHRHFAQFDTVRGFGLDDGLHGGWHQLQPPLNIGHTSISTMPFPRQSPGPMCGVVERNGGRKIMTIRPAARFKKIGFRGCMVGATLQVAALLATGQPEAGRRRIRHGCGMRTIRPA